MADLIAVVFPSEEKAEEVRTKVLGLTQEYLIDIGDAVIATKAESGRIKLNQMMNTTAAGAAGGGVSPAACHPARRRHRRARLHLLAAGTGDGARDGAAADRGTRAVSRIGLALAGEFVPFAVNVAAAEASETVRPFLTVAEHLGAIFAGLVEGLPPVIDIEYQGELAGYDTRILTLSVLKGVFSAASSDCPTASCVSSASPGMPVATAISGSILSQIACCRRAIS